MNTQTPPQLSDHQQIQEKLDLIRKKSRDGFLLSEITESQKDWACNALDKFRKPSFKYWKEHLFSLNKNTKPEQAHKADDSKPETATKDGEAGY